MAETKLKPQGMDTTTRLASKILVATRDLSASSGDVSYTGVGFQPTSLMVIANCHDTFTFSNGIADSSKTCRLISASSANVVRSYADMLVLLYVTNESNLQYCNVKTYDADGFTLTWTKAGSPTGTGTMAFLCFR